MIGLFILLSIFYILSIFISTGIMVEKQIEPNIWSAPIVLIPIANTLFILYFILFDRKVFDGWIFNQLRKCLKKK